MLWVVNGVLLIVLIGLLILAFTLGNKKPEETIPVVTEAPSTEPSTEAPTETEPAPTEPVMLAQLAELFEKNQDVAGWVRIDDTEIDYPFVYTPDDPNKYLYMDINGDHSYSGSIILEQRCSVEPESNNIILHGHNMKNGSMFAGIMNYINEDYWKEHPKIYFANLYEEREYEIIAVLHDKVYKKTDDVFKFYEFTDPQTEQEFNEGISYFKEHSFYDTELTAEFGDRLLMLVTCSYHVDDGRLVVVAREVVSEEAVVEESVSGETETASE
jgi:sortase B